MESRYPLSTSKFLFLMLECDRLIGLNISVNYTAGEDDKIPMTINKVLRLL